MMRQYILVSIVGLISLSASSTVLSIWLDSHMGLDAKVVNDAVDCYITTNACKGFRTSVLFARARPDKFWHCYLKKRIGSSTNILAQSVSVYPGPRLVVEPVKRSADDGHAPKFCIKDVLGYVMAKGIDVDTIGTVEWNSCGCQKWYVHTRDQFMTIAEDEIWKFKEAQSQRKVRAKAVDSK